jgi:hypothetical protein
VVLGWAEGLFAVNFETHLQHYRVCESIQRSDFGQSSPAGGYLQIALFNFHHVSLAEGCAVWFAFASEVAVAHSYAAIELQWSLFFAVQMHDM